MPCHYARAGPAWRDAEWAGNSQKRLKPLNVLFSRCLEAQFFQHMSQRMRAVPARPLSPDELINGSARQGEERLIGGDTGLAAVMARARMVSRSSAPVLLFGETGTGKEILSLIHI